MRGRFAAITAALAVMLATPAAAQQSWSLAIHGGAGVITRGSLKPEQEAG